MLAQKTIRFGLIVATPFLTLQQASAYCTLGPYYNLCEAQEQAQELQQRERQEQQAEQERLQEEQAARLQEQREEQERLREAQAAQERLQEERLREQQSAQERLQEQHLQEQQVAQNRVLQQERLRQQQIQEQNQLQRVGQKEMAEGNALFKKCIALESDGYVEPLGWVYKYRNTCNVAFQIEAACPGEKRVGWPAISPTTNGETFAFSNCKTPGVPKVWVTGTNQVE